MMSSIALKLFLLGMVLTAQVACLPSGIRQHTNFREFSGGVKVGDILDTKTVEVISYNTLMSELARPRFIYVGETHVSGEDHRVQLKIVQGLYAQNRSLILAMEMFPREVQPILDQYINGSISEEVFLKEANWDQNWGYPFALYRAILTWAREQQIRIIGLNAPREIVSKISQSGLSSLTVSERDRVARDFHLNDQAHREYIRQQFHHHPKGHISDFDTFLEAQLAWEETMAETLAETATSSPPQVQIIVLIGKGHISDRVGVPRLTYERSEQDYRTVAPIPVDFPDRTADPNIADFVWITDRSEPVHRKRLGAMFRQLPSPMGLEILGVLPDSPAARAGISKGDILYMVDGVPVTSLEEAHRAFSNKPIHEILLKRDGQTLSVTVTLLP
jgi:uncharacterized iron-regulated protein